MRIRRYRTEKGKGNKNKKVTNKERMKERKIKKPKKEGKKPTEKIWKER